MTIKIKIGTIKQMRYLSTVCLVTWAYRVLIHLIFLVSCFNFSSPLFSFSSLLVSRGLRIVDISYHRLTLGSLNLPS